MKTICYDDSNIDELRKKHPNGLHFVVGDTHSEFPTLKLLIDKIKFDPETDHVYFLGDYNGGGNPANLVQYLSTYYAEDNAHAGFHLIRGNHERELSPYFPLDNMPDIIVLKMDFMNYYMVHAGMIKSVFDLINADIADRPEERIFAYKLNDSSVGYDAPLRQIIWSRRGLYSQRSHWHLWPSQGDLYQNRAIILHGHTPYCYFMGHFSYGDDNLFWEKQHIWFSEDLQAFDVDANIKGRNEFGESWRGISCVCLEVFDSIAGQNNCSLSISDINSAVNGVFSAQYTFSNEICQVGDLNRLLSARPQMKTIMIGTDNALYLQ